MELLLILFCLLIVPTIFVAKAIKPYANGTKQIDQLKYPILARAQRIRRYKNVKAREIEASTRLKELTNKKNDIILESGNASAKAVAEVAAKHQKASNQWLADFKAITAAEDARKAAIAAKIADEKRAKELEIWQAEEKIRIAAFMEEQRVIQGEERRRAEELMKSRENDVQALRKYYVPDHNNQSFGYRIVSVHGLYVRKLPVKASRMVDNLTTGAMVSVNGWIQGEEVYGNPIWFKLANEAGWIWSGGVDNKSTSGLMNYNYMNEPGETFISKSFDGSITGEYSTPSEMKDLIDAEITAMEKEKAQLSLKMRGDSPWEMVSASMITSGSINADKISISPNILSITRNGTTVAQLAGGLTAPKETQYNIFSDGDSQTYQPSGHTGSDTNFWRGTQFENWGK